MKINKHFEQIQNNKTSILKGNKPAAVLYIYNLYLTSRMSKEIEKRFDKYIKVTNETEKTITKTFYVNVSTSGNQVKIDFLKKQESGSYKGIINVDKKFNLKPCWIGSVSLANDIATKLGLDLTKTKYFPSVDHLLDGDSLYLEFDKDKFNISKKKQNTQGE